MVGITLANYQIVSYAADRSVRFWHCTELYQGMILKIQVFIIKQFLDYGINFFLFITERDKCVDGSING